eukprot:TRINITY_DN15350_c1_g1_i1.p1 TRINITY_DN15350_c1_g1~~TRINITY_DN15350_c1_g1_i1.p1  ORF type:complete len:395 (+),score=125.79 TRINITY_DN15350_c1_g1_i1:89-1273(+)
MAPREATARLRKELINFHKDPPPFIHVSVSERNILDWDYLLEGPPDTPYQGGWYHGRVRFPPGYPHAPPEIVMFTESGRFKMSTPLCLSMSNYHPESWNPAWSVSTILKGLLSFMCEDTPTQGSVEPETTAEEKRRLAARSADANRGNAHFRKMFPAFDEIVAEARQRPAGTFERMKQQQEAGAAAAPAEATPAAAEVCPAGAAAAAAPGTAVPAAPAAERPSHADPAAAAGPPPSSGGTVSAGAEVVLKGLAARKDLNGAAGVVIALEGQRLRVRVTASGEEVTVRRSSAVLPQPAAPSPPASPAAAAEGAPAADRPPEAAPAAAAGQEPPLSPGDAVVIQGLVSKSELNGASGVIAECLAAAGRYRVVLDPRGGSGGGPAEVSVRGSCLRKA